MIIRWRTEVAKTESISRRKGDREEEALKVTKNLKDRKKRSGRVDLEWRTKELGEGGGRPTGTCRSPSGA